MFSKSQGAQIHKDKSYYILFNRLHWKCLALIVNLIQPRIIWEKSLQKGLSTQDYSIDMSSDDCLTLCGTFQPNMWRNILYAIVLNYVRAEKWNLRKVIKGLCMCIHFFLFLTMNMKWLGIQNFCLDFFTMMDCKLK